MSNCGKWLTKNEFKKCVVAAMKKHPKLFTEHPEKKEFDLYNDNPWAAERKRWMHNKINYLYKLYEEDMKDGYEDWGTYLSFNKTTYLLYVACDDHEAKWSYLEAVKQSMFQ